MAKSKKYTIGTESDYIKAVRKAEREYEIESYGKPLYKGAKVHKSPKDYNRREFKKINWED